ncbi:hypothetical protein LCGC14_2765950, partial [marine sediment metagenome]
SNTWNNISQLTHDTSKIEKRYSVGIDDIPVGASDLAIQDGHYYLFWDEIASCTRRTLSYGISNRCVSEIFSVSYSEESGWTEIEQVTETTKIFDDVISSDLEMTFGIIFPIFILGVLQRKRKKKTI